MQLISLAGETKKEICGLLLLQGGRDWEIKPVTNAAGGEDAREFHMDNDELLEIYTERFGDIIGVYHSHPSGIASPSGQDIAYAQTQWRYFIIAAGHVHEWRIHRNPKRMDADFVDKL